MLQGSAARSTRSKKCVVERLQDAHLVSKLHPKVPLISSVGDSILSVTQMLMLASKRGDAALVVKESGALAGIVTDSDITGRLVAKHVDAASTSLSTVMTLNPTCVATPSAMRNGQYVDHGRESLPAPSGS